jgi:hypothetical protein
LSARYWALAKRLLKESDDKSAVADILEHTARQEMGLPGRTSARTSADGSTAGSSAAVAVPAGLHGSFMAAAKLLREVLDLHKQAGRWSECWRLLSDYEGLRPLLRDQELDTITLVSVAVWYNVMAHIDTDRSCCFVPGSVLMTCVGGC